MFLVLLLRLQIYCFILFSQNNISLFFVLFEKIAKIYAFLLYNASITLYIGQCKCKIAFCYKMQGNTLFCLNDIQG